METYEDPATWAPEPVRPRWSLVLKFVATLLFFPLLCAFWLAAAAVLFVVGLFADAVAAVSEGFGRGYMRFMDHTLGGIARLGSWCVTWPELRHEGDVPYYRARVEKVVGNWTRQASAPHEPKKARPPVECEIPRRVYRGVGGRYSPKSPSPRGGNCGPRTCARRYDCGGRPLPTRRTRPRPTRQGTHDGDGGTCPALVTW
ncbi:hypothetical protein [Streptomyces sp. NPDC019793]|uniref:hypothetical protein n=1 Tax=unclassified Streptomyces TaxID=2593676 RepID=UPI0033E9A36C